MSSDFTKHKGSAKQIEEQCPEKSQNVFAGKEIPKGLFFHEVLSWSVLILAVPPSIILTGKNPRLSVQMMHLFESTK